MDNKLFRFKRAAVLGAGVMGTQIAAHLTNAGIQTILFDLPSSKGNQNEVAVRALHMLSKLNPPALAQVGMEAIIQAANYETELPLLQTCDLVIEAIAENLEWKKNLYQKITPFLAPSAILVTNTSSLRIQTLAHELPPERQKFFCGVHFFNPPRYMKLVEIVPHPQTDPDMLAELETFLVTVLGKGIIYAADTPSFIANRIGAFAMMVVLHHSAELGLPPDVVDALTGPLIGRAKSATYRTLDIVGLDTVAQVVQTLHKDLKDDPWHDYFVLPHWIKQLVERGWLGQKKQQGIYKKEGSSVLVYDEEDKNYRPRLAHVSAELQSLFYQQKNIPFSKLRTSADPQAQFVWRIFRDFFHYCAYHLPAIAHTAREVDLAMRWGYGWLQGPFEIWQTAGWLDIANAINEEITAGKTMCQLPLPQWVQSAQFSGPYLDGKAFSPRTNTYEKEAKLPIYSHQLFPDLLLTEHVSEGETIFETASVRCFILDDEYPILSFKTKHNCIDKGVLEGIQEAILYAQKHAKALILWQRHGQHFSVGADLRFARQALEHHEYEKIVAMAELFQQTALKMRYATIPIIAALRGCVLGGACELSMHATSRVVAFETYMGFVEKEIGLLPGGSGCKELAVRSSQSRDPQSVLEKYFIQILQAKVSISALEAKQLGYLLPNDRVVINTDELLYVAKEQARQLTAKGYFPPKPAPISVAGKEGMEKLLSILHELKAQKNLSAHDVRIGEKVAFILSGGEVPAGQLIDEATLLSLERQAIAELIQAKETYQRIKKRIDKNKIL